MHVGYFTPEYHPVGCAHACFYSSRSWVVVNTSVRSSRPGEFSATGLGVCACKAGRISIHSLFTAPCLLIYSPLLPHSLSLTHTRKAYHAPIYVCVHLCTLHTNLCMLARSYMQMHTRKLFSFTSVATGHGAICVYEIPCTTQAEHIITYLPLPLAALD